MMKVALSAKCKKLRFNVSILMGHDIISPLLGQYLERLV
jgi:hypothetical protein